MVPMGRLVDVFPLSASGKSTTAPPAPACFPSTRIWPEAGTSFSAGDSLQPGAATRTGKATVNRKKTLRILAPRRHFFQIERVAAKVTSQVRVPAHLKDYRHSAKFLGLSNWKAC